MSYAENPFEAIEKRLSNIDNKIENLLLAIKQESKEKETTLHSVKTLSLLAGVSELTVRNWITDGKVKAKRIGRRLFIEQSQFENGLQEVKSLKYKR